jgi:hypothetical protein
MFTAIFYFLGLDACIVGILFCCWIAKHAGQHVEVDVRILSATASCLSRVSQKPTWDANAKWHDLKLAWMAWFARCQETTKLRQQAMYSWARTLALCAALCLVGAFLEVEFGESISIDHIVAGIRQSPSVEAVSRTIASCPRHHESAESTPSLR